MTDNPKPETDAIHAGEQEADLSVSSGDIVSPIHVATHHEMEQPGESGHGYKYSRFGNPTRESLENRLAALTGADYATAFSSGTAAIATAALALCDSGDQVVAFDGIYGGTRLLFEDLLCTKLDVQVEYVDATDLGAVKEAVTSNTSLIWVETPTNPLLKLCDLDAIAEIATRNQVRLCVDNTFATPIFQQPLDQGADLVVHSTTKYLNGHSDSTGGAVATNESALADRVAELQEYAMGNLMSPFDSYLVLRGTKTLPLRMRQHEANAAVVAEFLDEHPSVRSVHYPGLESHPQHDLASAQMDGFGGVVSAELDATDAETRAVVEELDLFRTAVSLGGVESLVDHPWSMSASFIPPEERRDAGISESLIRLPVGIEHSDDLIADLEQGLDNLRSE
ncbi:PLP-dependent aspartate aminotransferase family protein [Halomicroarcula sp. F13]|uniref:PLP-dependent aspartate aminotransferase family protein n=1 Tax=Haloarcula rubra TaxID=2487747 RepID=A0AAW4PT10_9EURY|nr:PLP-dependent aspartate aminotransferase family protein [Halomicroarcula rubra]MBX0324370.1 PLP-dependent aspartate aminotransferase family protein [Halomicroarcula rubra]